MNHPIAHTVRRTTGLQATILVALALLTARGGAAQVFATISEFQGGSEGANPGNLIFGTNGALYGATASGGSSGYGTVFELAPLTGDTWGKVVLFSFNGADGASPSPNSTLAFSSSGALYGTTFAGGSGDSGGTVFELAPPTAVGGAWTQTVLYSLPGSTGMRAPWGGVLVGPGGQLYGTAWATEEFFGENAGGAVFMLTPPATPGGTWTESTVFSFWPPTPLGQGSESGLVSVGGSLYGTNTDYDSDCGRVYELSPPATVGGAWTGTTISTFEGGGCGPIAGLTVGKGGVLYGTTYAGGSGTCEFQYGPLNGCGTVFQLTPPATVGGAWTETVIYNFTGLDGDGLYPATAVLLGKDGVLYGTTQFGGSATSGSPCEGYGAGGALEPLGCGTVFQLTPPAKPGGVWTETILHSFTGRDGEGLEPGSLTMNAAGDLFGSTLWGGAAEAGTIFTIQK
jgi:uncharacterized repeat protein (TIGR03803 family)